MSWAEARLSRSGTTVTPAERNELQDHGNRGAGQRESPQEIGRRNGHEVEGLPVVLAGDGPQPGCEQCHGGAHAAGRHDFDDGDGAGPAR